MKFSVLMSTYIKDKPEHLRECLESITVYQSIKPDEIILVEDGPISPENSLVIKEFEKIANIKRIKLNINVGLGFALREGLNHCSTDLIARIDSDDVAIENRFEKQLDYFGKNPSTGVLGSNVQLIDISSEPMKAIRLVPELDKDIRKLMDFKNPLNHPTVMFNRKNLPEFNYENILYFEDWFLWLNLRSNKFVQFYNIQEPLLKYRVRSLDERNSKHFIKHERFFFLSAKKRNLISTSVFYYNTILRNIVRILPKKIYLILKTKFDSFH